MLYSRVIPSSENTNYRLHRNDLDMLCQNIVEALILDLFDYWTMSSRYYSKGKVVWLKETSKDVVKGLQTRNIAERTIRTKLKSLVDKNFLLAKRDEKSRNPKEKIYALNIPYITEKLAEIHEFLAENDGSAPMAESCVRDTNSTADSTVPGWPIQPSSYITTHSNESEEGNPPKPACSLDPVDVFASSVIPDVSPSPHPGYADRHSTTQDTEEIKQGAVIQSEKLKQAQTDQTIGNEHRQSGGSPSFPSQPKILLKQDKIQAEQGQEITNKQDKITDQSEDSEEDKDKTQIYQNTELEQASVFNASAGCDRRFTKIQPVGEFSKTEGQWLSGDGGQKLLQAMQAEDIDLSLWWKVLEYWQNEHQLWNWKGQEGFSRKTDLEKRHKTRNAFARWFNKGDNAIAFEAELECFKSDLRRAKEAERTKERVQKKEKTGGPLSKDHLALAMENLIKGQKEMESRIGKNV